MSKVHYAIIDGVSGTDVLGLLADDIDANATVGHKMPAPLPGSKRLLTEAVGSLLFDPFETMRATRSVVERPYRMVRKFAADVAATSDPNNLGRAVGPHRKWQSAKVPLEDLRRVRTAHGCSTTDVILAAVGGGIRNYLVEVGRPLPEMITVVVPLAVGAASAGISGQVTTLTAQLPIAEEEPQEGEE